MKILHVINNLTSGGAEKLLTDILPSFKKQGHDVAIVISNDKANIDKYEHLLAEANVRLINLNMSFYNPWQIVRLARIIASEKFDIVHAHLFQTQYWLAMASFFIPKNTTLIKTEHNVFNERRNYQLLRPVEKFVYSRYTAIIAITQEVKNHLSKWIGNNHKIVVINNGVNLKQVQSAKQDDFPALFNKTKHNLLMVARFDETQKDHTTLIEAFDLLSEKENYRLYLVGEGPNLQNIQEMVKDKGLDTYIHFLGRRTDVYNLMNKADLNILATLYEGLSGVTLESLASGTPFIGSDVAGVNDVVPDHSFLVTAKEPELLSQKIEELIRNDESRSSNISKATKHVQKYDTTFMVQSYLDLYKSTLNQN